MASVYPSALDTLATDKANETPTADDHKSHHNDLADAVNKVEAELGLSPSGAEATVSARLTGLDSTIATLPASVVRVAPSGPINGVNVFYTLAYPAIADSEEVYLNGLLLEPGIGNDYTIAGDTITFVEAPIAADRIRVSYRH